VLSAAPVVGAAGVLLNQVFIWPQVRRAVVTAEGIAALTVLGGLFARVAWTAYGAELGDVALMAGNVTVATGFLVLLVLLARHQQRAMVLGATAVALTATVVLADVAGRTVLGTLAVASAAVVNLPQMVRALRDRHRLAGVSVPTYLLIALASCCWLTYGVLRRDPLISAPHLLLLPSALLTAWLAHRGRRAQPALG
jgi:uncharacterized protein with PQ loop repeat